MGEQRTRKVSKEKYIWATAIAAAMIATFVLGYQIGLEYRVDETWSRAYNLMIDILSYSEIAANGSCDMQQAYMLGKELDRVAGMIDEEQYPKYLVKYYYLLQYMHMQVVQRLQKECNKDVHWIIFLFHKECTECAAQGEILWYFKQKDPKRIYIYAMNVDVDSPIVKYIVREYNVTKTPAVVIDGKLLEGIVDRETLESLLER